MSQPLHTRLNAALLVIAAGLSGCAYAQQSTAYPAKPIRIFVSAAAGGGIDTMARLIVGKATDRTGYAFILDNQSGAGGRIAVNKVATADPDGYTLLADSSSNLTLNQVFRRFERDVRQTLTPVVTFGVQPNMLFVTAGLPVHSVKELIAYAKANPGKLNYFSSGVGSTYHMGMVRFETLAGIKATHVIYKGGAQAAIDLAAGRLEMMFGSTSGLAAVRQGKARLIAVAMLERVPEFPDVPTMVEAGIPNFELPSIYGVFAPIGMRADQQALVNRVMTEAAATPDVKAKLTANGAMLPPLRTPAEIRKAWLADFEIWADVAKKANIKPEEVD